MGWGIEFKTDVYLSRQSYSSKIDVEDKISELTTEIKDLEASLKMYAASTPRDIIFRSEDAADEVDDAISYINLRVTEFLEFYRESVVDRHKLQLYLEYLNDGNEIVKSE